MSTIFRVSIHSHSCVLLLQAKQQTSLELLVNNIADIQLAAYLLYFNPRIVPFSLFLFRFFRFYCSLNLASKPNECGILHLTQCIPTMSGTGNSWDIQSCKRLHNPKDSELAVLDLRHCMHKLGVCQQKYSATSKDNQ